MKSATEILIFAPTSPLGKPGGIGCTTGYMKSLYSRDPRIIFSSPCQSISIFKSIKSVRFIKFLVSLFNLLNILTRAPKKLKIFIFSSAGFSFAEKLLWSLLIKLFGHQVCIIFVDGYFPKVWNAQNFVFSKIQTLLFKFIDPICLCQSEEWINYYTSIFGSSQKYYLFPSTSRIENELNETEFLKFKNTNNEALTIIYVGWVNNEKGFREFIYCAENNPKHNFKIIGPTFNSKSIPQDKLYNLPSNTTHILTIDNPRELALEFIKADIFLFPSRAEGLSCSMLEAISLGLPVVAYDILGNKNLVDNGENGFLVESFHISQFNSKLKLLLDSQERRREMSDKSRQKYMNQFSNYLFKCQLDFIFNTI